MKLTGKAYSTAKRCHDVVVTAGTASGLLAVLSPASGAGAEIDGPVPPASGAGSSSGERSMRWVNTVLCLLMVLFGAVQYNDPDGPTWMAVYLVPAVWAALAAWRAPLVARRVPSALLLGCIALSVAGAVHFWPRTPRWWTQDVWYEVETAREGMGLMIVTLVLGVAWISARRIRARGARGGADGRTPGSAEGPGG